MKPMKPPVYLDHNATTPVRPEAAEAVAAALSTVGNPSSVHAFGRAARRLLEEAREAVAALAGAPAAGVVFTGCGTEANTLALLGCSRPAVVVSAVEHDSVIGAAPSAAVVPVDVDGLVDLDHLATMLVGIGELAVVSVMLANNETGVIQPVARVAEIARRHGALVHCDAVQAAGRLPLDMKSLGVHMMTLSAHKIGGPQGIGALLVEEGVSIEPLLRGGGQEGRRRAGTQNLPGAAGFGAAARVAMAQLAAGGVPAAWRDRLEAALKGVEPDLRIFGEGAPRLANTSCLAAPGMPSETQVMALDLAGIAVSAGAACSSGKVGPSRVLTAMGGGELANAAIRVSFGWTSRDADVDAFVAAWTALRARIRGRSGAAVS
ncbi:cysteine desulfurase family protein [Shumkonia mesophila]|uniref:cysteine desulfurase family protein n=1 Tax=Shumkonia mesophila TaxID=2838854 RepID=UPI0029347D89|nr:cysteine desulfurase family protein [Shumkonia mesophila]